MLEGIIEGMSRLLLVVALGAATGLMGGDFSGQWAGTTVNADGQTTPIYLTLKHNGEAISGILSGVEPKGLPLSDAVVRNDELRFRVRENDAHPTEFALTMVAAGNPSFDPRVALRGTATVAAARFTVTLYPVGESLGERGAATPPSLVYKVEPRYTEQARAAKVQGAVVLKVEIEETGMLAMDQIQVVRSLGYGLDEAAADCVRQWRFQPAFRNGYAVKTAATLEVRFRP